MKVFITGGTGMVGSFLIEALLQKGHRVKVLVRPTSDLSLIDTNQVAVVKGDITEEGEWIKSVEGSDAVFHIAALMKDWGPREEFMKHNVIGTVNILRAIKKYSIKKLMYVSTRSVMGMDACNNADESWPYRYSNVYGYSKVLAEKKVVEFGKSSQTEVVIIRPTWVIGPRDRYSVNSVIAMVKNGSPILINNGDVFQSFVHPGDVADALVKAMEYKETSGKIYLIDSGERRTIRELFELFAKEMSINLKPRAISYHKALMIGYMLQIKALLKKSPLSPPLTPIRAKFLGRNHTYNIVRAKNELGYSPHFKLEDMVHEAFEYWKKKSEKGKS